jgi:hypothetical protein
MTRPELEGYIDLLKHILRDPDVLIKAAAQRNMSVFDAYIGVNDDLNAAEGRLRLLDGREGVKA